jgi:hypothetical protein
MGSSIKLSFCLFVLASALSAASDFGAISGTVTDWNGVPISRAFIQAKKASGAEFRATSTAAGSYTLTELPVGAYQISITSSGMKPYEKQNVVVSASQDVRVDARLEDYQGLNTLGEGRDYISERAGSHSVPSGPTPRTSEGKPDFSGVWRAIRTLDPGKPEMTPWAELVMKERTENHAKDWPGSRCLPGGATVQGMFLPYRIVQTPAILAIVYEEDMPRQIHLDGRVHPKDWDPTFLGHSTGAWEGDELVVDTVGFNDKTWIDTSGHPHTEKLHLTERYRRPDLGHLEVQITIDDPGAYKRPWTIKKISDLAPNTEEIGQYICAENNQDVPHLVGQ